MDDFGRTPVKTVVSNKSLVQFMPVTSEKSGEPFINLEVVERNIGDLVAPAAAALAAPTELAVTEQLIASDSLIHISPISWRGPVQSMAGSGIDKRNLRPHELPESPG